MRLIWHDGSVIPEESLRVGVDDRVFEHGLGLFETFRSWDGRTPLLGRHLARLRASAEELGIDLAGVRLPDPQGVLDLLEASGGAPGSASTTHHDPRIPPVKGPGKLSFLWANPDRGKHPFAGDSLLRLTVTAGSKAHKPIAWMMARSLPPLEKLPLRVITQVAHPDPSVDCHKMLNYWGRRVAFDQARRREADEVLLTSPEGHLLEASRNSVLVVPEGSRTVATPPLDAAILPGVMRRVALDFAAAIGYRIEERTVAIRELSEGAAVFLTNSVRGVRPVGAIDGRSIRVDETLSSRFTADLPRYVQSLPGAD